MLNLIIFSFIMFIISMFLMFISFLMYLDSLMIFLEWEIYFSQFMMFSYIFYFDLMSLMFSSIVLFISSMVMLYSYSYMSDDMSIKRFYFLVIMFIISMLLMILSPSILSIMVGWDGLGLISFCLVIYYSNMISLNSGMLTILCNRLGDIGLLMSISLCSMYGSWNLMLYFEDYLISLMLLLSAITKSAQLPFSSWLPAAMTAPTPVSSLVHSSTLVTAGVYLLIRYNNFIMYMELNKFLLYISMMTMFMAGMMANFEFDLKKIIALSTLSQLSFMMMSLSIGFYEMSFFHLIVHALFKSLMFLCAGDFIHSMSGDQDIRNYKSMIFIFPLKSSIILVSLLSLMGFPYLSGFYSKDLIIEIIFNYQVNFMFMVMFYLSMLLTISYSIRLIIFLMLGNFNFFSYMNFKQCKIMSFCMFILFNMVIFFGFNFFMFMFNKNYYFISLMDKFLILEFYLLGLYMGIYFYLKSNYKYKNLIYFVKNMFYFNIFYKISYLDLFKFIFLYEIINEKNWLDWFMGLYYLKWLSLLNKFLKFKNLEFMYLISFYNFLILMILFF